jgi:protein N-terminal asparagine amidohydrolase
MLHRSRSSLELVTCCVGEVCTIRRSGTPWPLLYGIGINVKTGEIFPAQFTDKAGRCAHIPGTLIF